MSIKRFLSFFLNWQVQIAILFIHIFLGVIALYNFIFNLQLTESYLAQDIQDKQAIIAKSGARSIENFFNNIASQLSSLVFSFEKIDENTLIDKNNVRKEFAKYINNAKAPVSGMALYDESGKLSIIENSQKITAGENENFSDEDFIKWSKDPQNRDKVFISAPLISRSGASRGKTIMAMATTLYFGNRYRGTLAIRFLLNQFRDAFISPLTSDLEEDIIIVDSTGTLVTGDDKLSHKNLITYASESKWNNYEDFINKFKYVIQKQQTKTSWTFKYPDGKEKKFLIATSKIDVPNTDNDLYLIVSIPEENSTKPLSPIRSYGSIWAILSIVFSLLGGTIYIIIKRLTKSN